MPDDNCTSNRIARVDLDDSGLPPPTPEVEHERRLAIFDLLEDNRFGIVARGNRSVPAGPYHLDLSVMSGRLVFDISTERGEKVGEFHLALSQFRQVIRDYFCICQSYFDAVKRLPPARIETIDMGRRAIHDAGGRLLMERLKGKVKVDLATSRRLFTLVCVLHFKG